MTKHLPQSIFHGIGTPKHDLEGRCLTLEFNSYFLISTYFPNSGMYLLRHDYRVNEWDPSFLNYVVNLKQHKPVILAGDFNVAHT